jgi:hypothetical protein
MQTNAAADSLGKLVQVCIDYASGLPAGTREAVVEYVQKHARVVNVAIKDEPSVGNIDQ